MHILQQPKTNNYLPRGSLSCANSCSLSRSCCQSTCCCCIATSESHMGTYLFLQSWCKTSLTPLHLFNTLLVALLNTQKNWPFFLSLVIFDAFWEKMWTAFLNSLRINLFGFKEKPSCPNIIYNILACGPWSAVWPCLNYSRQRWMEDNRWKFVNYD